MRNNWTIWKDPVIGWSALLAEESLGEVLRHGEQLGVYRVLAAPKLGYDRRSERRGYVEFLSGLSVTDPLSPLKAILWIDSRLAYADSQGSVVEGEVADLGEVLAAGWHALEPRHQPPLRISAFRWSELVILRISSYSDIWLPWCPAYLEEDAERTDVVDNRELARRHTPRLNTFLARVAELADRSGGWLKAEPDDTSPRLAFQLDDHGVRLDAPDPLERTVWRPFGRGIDLARALLDAALAAERDPPPAPYRAAIGVWSVDSNDELCAADRDAVREALRAIGVGGLLVGPTRVKVSLDWTLHIFEPSDLDT